MLYDLNFTQIYPMINYFCLKFVISSIFQDKRDTIGPSKTTKISKLIFLPTPTLFIYFLFLGRFWGVTQKLGYDKEHTLIWIGLEIQMTALQPLPISFFWDLTPSLGAPRNNAQLHDPQRRINIKHQLMRLPRQCGCPLFSKNLFFQSKNLPICYVTILAPHISVSIQSIIRA